MLGSSILKLDVNQTLIFCLRPSKVSGRYRYIIRCSQYHIAMGKTDTDVFQVNSPRPYIHFEKMSDVGNIVPFITKDKDGWIKHFAKSALNRVEETTMCKHSWQDDLVKHIKKRILADYVRNTTEEQFQIDKASLQDEDTNI